VVDLAIITDDFGTYDKKKAKKLAESYDFFIAQANIMPKVASAFGKILGTRGKMPNPKAGCVVPPKSNLKPLCEKLQKTVRVKAKELLAIQCRVGTESQQLEQVADNINTIYKQLVHHLPNHENNISKVLIKLTMGKVVEIK
jgi:large subunit ribosomal protein L1